MQDVRPGQGNAGQLFVSENVESDAKSVHQVLWIVNKASCVPSIPSPRPSFPAI